MTFLDLSHNYIYGMKPTVFGDNSYATELRLDYNYLTTMAGVPLDNQVGIRMLNVSHNQVSVLTIRRELFRKMNIRNAHILHNTLIT